jgi:exodeoxyribonuclease-3
MPTCKLTSWNVNGLRAVIKKGFGDFATAHGADFLCLQETKVNPGTIPEDTFDYGWTDHHCADKKGYSGTAIYANHEPSSIDLDFPNHVGEGRTMTIETPHFFLVNSYVPNAQAELARLPYRMEWDKGLRTHLQKLNQTKPVILCGDLNVAHEEIDIARPGSNRKSPGFTDEERQSFSEHLKIGLIDTFRYLNPDTPDQYSWWSYRGSARAKNVGWRIDYFLISERLKPALIDAQIHQEVHGSDHCPVSIVLDLDSIPAT